MLHNLQNNGLVYVCPTWAFIYSFRSFLVRDFIWFLVFRSGNAFLTILNVVTIITIRLVSETRCFVFVFVISVIFFLFFSDGGIKNISIV